MKRSRSPPAAAHRILYFGDFVLDLDRAQLFKGSAAIKLRPKSFDVLCCLVQNHGRLVKKQELLQTVWADTAVTEDSLTHCIIDARRAIEDTDREIIRTVPRRGFLFDLPVEQATESSVARALWPFPPAMRRRSLIIAVVIVAVAISIQSLRPQSKVGANVGAPDTVAGAAEARDRYTQARFLFQRRAPGDLETAGRYFLQAIELNPRYAAAWAGLAGIYTVELSFKPSGDHDELLTKLKKTAEKAVALDSTNAEGLLRLSQYHLAIGDHDESKRLIEQATMVDPDSPLLLGILAGRYAFSGNIERAIELQRLVLEQEPLSFVARGNLSYFLLAAGHYEEALRESRRAHQLNPDLARQSASLQAFALILLQRYDEALQLVETWPASPEQNAVMAMALHRLGQLPAAAESLELLKSSNTPTALFRHAEVLAFCEEIERSFAVLNELRRQLPVNVETAFFEFGIWHDAHLSPFLAPMRVDPRWREWLHGSPVLVAAGSVGMR